MEIYLQKSNQQCMVIQTFNELVLNYVNREWKLAIFLFNFNLSTIKMHTFYIFNKTNAFDSMYCNAFLKSLSIQERVAAIHNQFSK